MNIPEAFKTLQKFDMEHRSDLTLKLLGEIGKKSLYFLAKYILGYKDITKRTHGEIIATLEAKDQRKLIVVPRGCFKSTLGVVCYSIYRLINDPDIRILIDSELFTNSSTFLREIKAHLTSDLFVAIYGEMKGTAMWNDSEIVVSMRKVQKKEASITCSGIGAGKTGQHYDLIIGDDYNSPLNSNTLENRQKIINHYKLNQSILEPQGEYVIIGTRYAEDDLIGWILQNEIAERKEATVDFQSGGIINGT